MALVSEDLWLGALGQRPLDAIHLELIGVRHRVVGVVPTRFAFPRESQVWVALRDDNPSRTAHNYQVVGRLNEGVTIDFADTNLDRVQARGASMDPGEHPEYLASAVSVRPLRETIAGDASALLGVLLAGAGLVLLIACANLASTLLARGTIAARSFTSAWPWAPHGVG